MVHICVQLRLSLTELDRRFSYLIDGKTYHGEAINPRGLSLWEPLTCTGKVSFICGGAAGYLEQLRTVFPSGVRQGITDMGARCLCMDSAAVITV